MHAPTGEQILLEHGAVRAEIGSVGAVLRSLRVDGVDLTESVPAGEAPEFCNGVVLSPWPNRVRDARWMLDGAVQQLDITEPVRGGALHGVLQFAEYEVRGRTTEAVTLGARIAPQHGWPFELDTWVRYEVVDDGLTVTHGVENRAARTIRRGSSANVTAGSRGVRSTRASRSSSPPNRSTISPNASPASDAARAFTVKSRRERSSSSVPSSTMGLRESAR